MLKSIYFTTCLVVSLLFATSAVANDIAEESIYNQFSQQLIDQKSPQLPVDSENQKLLVDALWDQITLENNGFAQQFATQLKLSSFSLAQQIRLERLSQWPKVATLSSHLAGEIRNSLWNNQLDREAISILDNYSDEIQLDDQTKSALARSVKNAAQARPVFRNKTKEEIKDLFFNTPDLENFADGIYSEGIRLFMFCRKNRIYPCIMLMKDKNNQPVLSEDGKFWHHPALGMSKHRIPYYKRNGDTPSGILTIDSVMPSANRQAAFGKFRRLILNFVTSSPNEKELKKALPASARQAHWWKEGTIARDVGRNLLRIHGTGRLPDDRRSPNYPLRPTLGCIMQREGKVGRITYKDQRKLLDQVMTQMGLEAKYDNETKITGLIYLIDLDNKRKAVSYNDLMKYLK